jgi:hypothetical protein
MTPAMMLTSAEPLKVTEQGWVIEVTEEMAQVMGLPVGGFVLMSGEDGVIRTEVLPPPSPDLEKLSDEIMKKNFALYQELKRIGD